MKFVLLKGAEGFGDRLQCLLQAIWYAKVTGRILVVDWRDEAWSHNGCVDAFDDYFFLTGIDCLPLAQFHSLISNNIISTTSCIPSAWSTHILDPRINCLIREAGYVLPENNHCISRICEALQDDFTEDIVVYSGIGYRHYNYSDASHIHLTESVKQYVLGSCETYGLHANSYDAIHLRGGTKTWFGGNITDDHPDVSLHTKWADSQAYLSDIYEVLTINTTGLSWRPLYIMTDTPLAAEQWISLYGKATLLPNSAHGLMGTTGIHKIDTGHLSTYTSITKEIINLEAIRDFVIMTNARVLVGDGISLFSLMAFHLSRNNQLLYSLKPDQSGHSMISDNNYHYRVKRWSFN